jgi:hypothetical protein
VVLHGQESSLESSQKRGNLCVNTHIENQLMTPLLAQEPEQPKRTTCRQSSQ